MLSCLFGLFLIAYGCLIEPWSLLVMLATRPRERRFGLGLPSGYNSCGERFGLDLCHQPIPCYNPYKKRFGFDLCYNS